MNLFKIENDTITDAIVADPGWEKLFPPESGYVAETELSGELVIGATRQSNGSFASPPGEEPLLPLPDGALG
jgi:hypothetical protein